MASIKTRLKRRDGTAFDDLFPEVTAPGIVKSDGTALSTFSSELLISSQDSSNITFVTGDSDGGFNLRTASEVLSSFSMASANYSTGTCSISTYNNDFENCLANGGTYTPTSNHTHTQSQVNACYIVEDSVNVYKANRWSGDTDFGPSDESRCETAACSLSQYNNQNDCVLQGGTWWAGGTWTTLSTALGYKADVDSNSKLLFSQLPDGVNVKAMKFVGVTGDLGASGSAVTLSSKFALNSLSTGDLDKKLGDYLIATNSTTNRFIKENTSNGNSYEFILTTNTADDDQPSSPTNVEIEAGDRIVFTNYTGDATNGFTFQFTVINGTQTFAGTQQKGIVELSAAGQTLNAYDTGTATRYDRVVDEKSLRDAMKDQRKIIEFTGNTEGQLRYWATASSNLPTSGITNGWKALVGTGTTKDIYEFNSTLSGWVDTSTNVTFPTNAASIPSGTFNTKDIVYYDAGQTQYLYLNGTSGSANVLSVASNTSTSTILPADGDLVYWISP